MTNENMIADLIAARKKMPTLSKDSKNEHFRNKYVSLETLIEAVVPILNEHNLTVAQFPTTLDGQPALKTSILHTSGAELTDTMLILAVKDDPQGQGSGITYARRYALMSMLGIAGESDDDGEASRRSFDRVPTRQAAPAAQRAVAQQRANGKTIACPKHGYGPVQLFPAKTNEDGEITVPAQYRCTAEGCVSGPRDTPYRVRAEIAQDTEGSGEQ